MTVRSYGMVESAQNMSGTCDSSQKHVGSRTTRVYARYDREKNKIYVSEREPRDDTRDETRRRLAKRRRPHRSHMPYGI